MAGPPPSPRTDSLAAPASGPVVLPADLGVIADRVEACIADMFEAERQRWTELDPSLADPLHALRTLVLNGGKRLRPAFCHWGFRAAGGPADDVDIVRAGAAFELLQGFALIHDDVMDGSASRRGAPAVHRQFVDRHRDQSWAGESRRFGEGVAILAGDLALVYADRLLPDGPPAMDRLWHELRVELNVGQYLDLIGTAQGRRDRDGTRRIARYKSGKYTIERPLQLGAALAGGAELAEPLSRYGDPLGEAFQLRDDVLGVFGDSARTGKPVGDDLREGKPTLLLAVAHEQADTTELSVLDLVGDPDLSSESVARLQEVLVATGALSTVEAEIDRLAETAVTSLAHLPADPEVIGALEDLAAFVVARSG